MPAETPVTIPVLAPTVATPVLLLLHVPPLVALASVVVAPTQAAVVPVIEVGVDTETNVEAKPTPQVFATPYTIATTPLPVPVTRPVAFTEAILLSVLYQNPPAILLASGVVPPVHIVVVPVIAGTDGTEFTVTPIVA